jgi:DNA polymerase alpha subunit A
MIEDGTPVENLPCIAQTFVRPLLRFPKDFEKAAKETKKSTIIPVANERMLLNSLLGERERSSEICGLTPPSLSSNSKG